MFTFSPNPDDGPFVAWSWARSGEHLVDVKPERPHSGRFIVPTKELPYVDATLDATVARLVQAGFRAIDLPIPKGDDAEKFDATLRLLGFCHAAGVNIWLRPDELRCSNGCLYFEIADLGTSEAANWQLPVVSGRIFHVEAVALDKHYGAPRWPTLRSLELLDNSQHQQILTSLAASGAGVRVWVWHKAVSCNSDDLQDQWLRTAGDLIDVATKDGSAAVVRGVHLAQFGPNLIGHGFKSFPYVAGLEERFEEIEGQPFPGSLAWLIGATGDDAVRLRRHYWEALAQKLDELYWKPAEQFCAERTLILRGIVGVDDRSQGLLIMPGHKGAATLIDRRSAPVVVRRATSFAALAGLKPALASPAFVKSFVDTYLVPDWADTPARSAPLCHRLLADGASALETAGVTPFDLGEPSLLQQPFAPHMGTFNSTLANMTAAMAGAPAARVGLLWPDRSLQVHFNPRGHRNVRWVEEDLNATVSLLDELHFDFIFCDESHLETATVESGNGECTLLCGAVSHPLSLIVLPSVTALSWATWSKLEEFVAAGGKLVCLGLLPRWSEKGRDTEFEDRVGKNTMLIVSDLYSAYATAGNVNPSSGHKYRIPYEETGEIASVIGYPVVRSQPSGGRVGSYQPRLNDDRDDARLRVNQLLTESITPDMETQAEDVRLTRRQAPGGDIVMVTNMARHAQRVNLRVRTRLPAWPYLCDPRSGYVTPIYEWMELSGIDGHGVALTLEMGAGEVVLVQVADDAPFSHVERSNFVVESFEAGIIRGHATSSGIPHASVWNAAEKRLVQLVGVVVALPAPIAIEDPWEAELGGFNMLAIDLPYFKQEAAYIGAFEVRDAVGALWLRLPTFAGEVTLNGQALTPLPMPLPQALLAGAPASTSGDTRWFELVLKAGNQELRVADVYEKGIMWSRREENALVVGDFLLDDDGFIVVARPLHLETGTWHDQGLRDYSGEVTYRKTVSIPVSFGDCRVFLELHGMRDTVEALIEGVSLGVRSEPPYRFEATTAVRSGEECAVALRVYSSSAAAERRLTDFVEEVWGKRETPPAGLLGPARLVAYPMVELREKP